MAETDISLRLRAVDDASRVIEGLSSRLEALKGHIHGIGEIAVGGLLGGLGVQGIDAAIRGVVDFGKSMIDANAQTELMRQRLNILYGSAAEGAQAFAFLKQNELTKPFDFQSIMGAATQLVAFKQDITTVLPALEDVAGAMGQTLPTAARAFNDALMGRFAMLKNDLGISKEMLVQFGLEMNKAGHITNPESFTKAFLALANSNEFKGGADKLAQTWTGLMSSMSTQWFYLKSNLGQGAFTALEQSLHGLVHTLQDPKNSAAIQQIEAALGGMLGKAAAGAVQLGHTLIATLPAAIGLVEMIWLRLSGTVANVWNAIGRAVQTVVNWIGSSVVPVIASVVGFIAGHWGQVATTAQVAWNLVAQTIGTVVNWLGANVLPAVATVIGTVAVWWAQHANDVQRTFAYIKDRIADFLTAAIPLLRQGWNILVGDARYLWDSITLLFTLGQDLVKGNFGDFGKDLVAGMRRIGADLVQQIGNFVDLAVTALTQLGFLAVKATIPLADALFKPWTSLAIGIRQVFDQIGQVVGSFVGMLVKAGTDMGNAILRPINGVIDALKGAGSWLGKIPGFGGIGRAAAGMHDLSLGGAQGNADAAQSAIVAWFRRHAPGIDPNQTIHAGVSVAQAQAGADSARDKLLGPFDAWLKGIVDKIVGEIDPSRGGGGAAATKSAQSLGKEIIANIFGALGLGGTGGGGKAFTLGDVLGITKSGAALTWADILKQLGIDMSKVPAVGGMPDHLLVSGPTGGPDGAAAAARGATAPGATGRVPLGALGATFGQTLATLSGMHAGTDPATRAVQQQLRIGTRQLTAQEKSAATLEDLHAVMVDVLAALKGATRPAGTPPSGQQLAGVLRPHL